MKGGGGGGGEGKGEGINMTKDYILTQTGKLE